MNQKSPICPRQRMSRGRVLLVAGLLLACAAPPARAMRVVSVDICEGDRPVLMGIGYDWGRLLPSREYVRTSFTPYPGYRVRPDSQDPRKAVLTGDIRFRVSASGSEQRLVRWRRLLLERSALSNSEWVIPEAEWKWLLPEEPEDETEPEWPNPLDGRSAAGFLVALALAAGLVRRRRLLKRGSAGPV